MNKMNKINYITKRTLFTIVNQAEIAYRELLGMNRVQLKPGFRIKLPFFHQLHRVDMRERCVLIKDLNGFTSDNVPVTASGALFFKVENPEKALFSISNYVNAISNIGESVSRAVLGKFSYDSIISKRNEINSELINTIDKSIDTWGITCNRFEITDFKPQNKDVARYLEIQMEAERKRRENELNTQAKIRTAEGERDASNLQSDATLYKVKIEADSKAYSVEKNAEAFANQIKVLCSSFNNKLTEKELMSFILELERQKNLNAIASNPSSKVYFIDPKNMFPTQRHINIDPVDVTK
jgi:regulator of protease activity HflC (stomatin/prohibitin superfamily)